MRFVVGDLHLECIWDGLDRSEDIFTILYNIHAYVHRLWEVNDRENCDIVWLGDIFDSCTVSHTCISRFMEYLKSFDPAISHKILKGNHDGEPNSKKSSPLKEIEAAQLATVYWEPTVEGDDIFIPYCTQKVLDKFTPDITGKTIFTHVDIIGLTPGTEKEIGVGLPCVLPEWIINHPDRGTIWSGHIHHPQEKILWYGPLKHTSLCVVGSVLQTKISEQDDIKRFIYIMSNGLGGSERINSREIKHFDVTIGTVEGNKLYENLLKNDPKLLESTDIVSIRMLCPHNLGHLIDQNGFEDAVRKHCYYLRYSFTVQKEKKLRMKELDAKLSDIQIGTAFIEKQGLSEKELILQDMGSIMQ